MGFRPSDTVLVGGQPALVTSISPNEITAIAPAAAAGVTGSVDVEVDDLPIFYAAAIISGGVSYDAGTGDSLTLVTAPANTVPIGVPLPFTVTALGSNLAPAGGVTVTYTVTSGAATLGCGSAICPVTATGDGLATMNVTATTPIPPSSPPRSPTAPACRRTSPAARRPCSPRSRPRSHSPPAPPSPGPPRPWC